MTASSNGSSSSGFQWDTWDDIQDIERTPTTIFRVSYGTRTAKNGATKHAVAVRVWWKSSTTDPDEQYKPSKNGLVFDAEQAPQVIEAMLQAAERWANAE